MEILLGWSVGIIIAVLWFKIEDYIARRKLDAYKVSRRKHGDIVSAFYRSLPPGYDHCSMMFLRGEFEGQTLESYLDKHNLRSPPEFRHNSRFEGMILSG